MGRIKDGVLVLDFKKSEDGNRTIISKEKKVFNSSDIEIYLEKFKRFSREGIIENKSYTDNTWKIVQPDNEYINRVNVDFEFEINPCINTVLKFYCLDMITNKIGPASIYTTIKKISEALIESNIFNEDYYEDFEDYIYCLSPNSQMRVKDYLDGFLSYYHKEIPERYVILLNSIANAERHRRVLPDYRSILYFGYFMEKLVKEADKKLILKYYPIILWWYITSNIPIRVVEFTLIKKEGCYKNNGACYLDVTRAKPHSYKERALNERKNQTFKISEDIYNMAYEYMNIDDHTGEYLLSYNLFKVNFNRKKKVVGYEFIPSWNLRKMLCVFYDEVIYGMYGFNSVHKLDAVDIDTRIVERTTGNNIVRLQLGDTRHLAIINLVIQGRNPYTIKELAGHKDINSFEHYANHMEKYVESKTLVLAEDIRQQLNNLMNGKQPVKLGNRRNDKLQHLLLNDLNKNGDLIELKEGVCIRYIGEKESFPNLCLCDCTKCEGFIRDIEKLSNEKLNEELQEIKDNLNLQIEIIKFYYLQSTKEGLLNKKTGELNIQSQRTLTTSVNRMKSLISQKATIEAYKLKINEIENKNKFEGAIDG